MWLGVFILCVMGVGALWQRSNEIAAWNGGVCCHNGLPWEYFDTSSQGCRGYNAGDYHTWISYAVDK